MALNDRNLGLHVIIVIGPRNGPGIKSIYRGLPLKSYTAHRRVKGGGSPQNGKKGTENTQGYGGNDDQNSPFLENPPIFPKVYIVLCQISSLLWRFLLLGLEKQAPVIKIKRIEFTGPE